MIIFKTESIYGHKILGLNIWIYDCVYGHKNKNNIENPKGNNSSSLDINRRGGKHQMRKTNYNSKSSNELGDEVK